MAARTIKNIPSKLYFAYGANLDKKAMRLRCPDAVAVCRATALNRRFVFKGVADIVEDKTSTVRGAIWMISEADEKELDRFEGFPRLYVKKQVMVQTESSNSAAFPVMAYVMTGPNERMIAPPCDSYLATISRGLRDFGYGEPEQNALNLASAEANSMMLEREAAIDQALAEEDDDEDEDNDDDYIIGEETEKDSLFGGRE